MLMVTRLSNGPSIQAPTLVCSIRDPVDGGVRQRAADAVDLIGVVAPWTLPKMAKSDRCTLVLGVGA